MEKLKTEPFADVARKYSADSRSARGGVWKDVDPAEVFRAEVCDALLKLKPGETGPWVELDGWNFLLRLDAVSEAHERSFADAYDDIVRNLRETKAKAAYDAWMTRLKAEAYIKIY